MTSSKMTIGVDIGGTNIRAALVGEDGELGAHIKFRTESEHGPDELIPRLAEHLRGLIAQSPGEVKGVGVGCPGPLSSTTGIVYEAPNLFGWVNIPLGDRLSEALGLPVRIHNDANAATWGEFWLGAGRDVGTIVMYTLGTGVGGGLVIGGRLWTGPDDTAGELGHICIFPDGERCSCGARGCLEAYASAPAVARRAREALASGRESSLSRYPAEELTAHKVDHEADAGDALSIEIMQQTAEYLGLAAAAMVNALNPDLVIYGGGMTAAKAWLFPVIERVIAERCFDAPAARVRVVAAELGDDAGIIGAAGLAMSAL
ncbi:ROK family protein [Candidatus Sumerlaeota bacterium]|nr:ROK family protein [Candidatus Sumerlaeota bacterium]